MHTTTVNIISNRDYTSPSHRSEHASTLVHTYTGR